jgi:outer membrane protein assembly factor BamB
MNAWRVALFGSWLICVPACPLHAANFDWYRWRGPDLNGISKESGWSATWTASGPKQLWKASVGTGFSSIVVANERAYTMGNRKDKETVYCFDAVTGAEVWKHTYDCDIDSRYYDGGPSATPTVDGDRVFTLSRKGHLYCFTAVSGKVIWEKSVNDELGLKVFKENTPEWGYSGSPLVIGEKLILNVGTAGAAFDKSNGKVTWITGKQLSGYSTHVPFNVGAETYLAVFGAKGAYAVALKDGKQLWHYPFETDYDVNAADPIISGNKVFISAGYGHGAALFQSDGNRVTRIWENRNMRNQFNSCVLIDGHLYGMDGDHGSRGSALRCIEFESGKVKWSEPSVKPGALMASDGKLIVLSEPGELIIAEASPDSFRALARAQVIGGKCWTTPVLSNGRVYCRNSKGEVVCLGIAAKSIVAGP